VWFGAMGASCSLSRTSFVEGHRQSFPFMSVRTNSMAFLSETKHHVSLVTTLRGGDATAASDVITETKSTNVLSDGDEPSLDEKVFAAMKKLGMSPPTKDQDYAQDGSIECENGACSVVGAADTDLAAPLLQQQKQYDPTELSNRIAMDMGVDARLSMAALGATSTLDNGERNYNEAAARDMIQQELDLISSIPADSKNVQTLVAEGFDNFFCRRALAFAENNLEDARAILIADQIDEEEAEQEEQRRQQQRSSAPSDFVEVQTDFDPTKQLPTVTNQLPDTSSATVNNGMTSGMPKPASKESVVFEATTAQIQELVLESPVPVLLDIYAEWCGPCKVLGPALEEMAIKSGGMFRLVKVNSDNERPVSQTLEVTALPTVFGVRDGKIIHMFQGMPKSEDMMKNFMMGLFGAAPFSPSVTAQETQKYEELTGRLIKAAGAASFSFSARERLTDRITTKLDELVKDDSVPDVEGCATLIRTLLNNIIKDPYNDKYRKINLQNRVVATNIGGNASCLSVLKSVGFAQSEDEMVLAKGKRVINVAPLVIARDCIDKWIQRNRNEMASAARKRQDEIDRTRILTESNKEIEEAETGDSRNEEKQEVDPLACTIRLRLDGKRQIHETVFSKDDPLNKVLEVLDVNADEEVQLVCVAKKLVVKSSDKVAMTKSLEAHGLMPAASVVVKIGSPTVAAATNSTKLKERAAGKNQKKGSHTMQSIGIYSKDDNNKAELIDGGGGVWYEHDISDEEEEDEDKDEEERASSFVCEHKDDHEDSIDESSIESRAADATAEVDGELN
jgi:thiol-disulfide isomerase/thioredoxin